MTLEHRRLTLMFTDIVGYSKLMGQNEAQTIELLGEYRRILLSQIEKHNGTVIEFIGDAVFARFDKPEEGVQAGIDIQKDLIEYNVHSSANLPKLQSRIGIHMGEVALKDDALFGDDVNIAARLEPIAVADGLCISECVYKAVKPTLREPIKPLGVQPLKNIDGKIKAYLVRPSGITLRTHLHYFQRKFQQKLGAYRYPITAAVLLFVAAGFYFVPRWLVPGYTANYVEIADFKNLMSSDGSADYFSSGITEALRSQLADIRDVYIIEADKGVRGPVRLEGSVQKVGESLRIAYQLFRRKDNVQIAGGKLDGAYNDIFILQDRVVAEIAGYLAQEFSLKNFRPAGLNLTSDVTAYDYYLRGLEFLKKPPKLSNYDSAVKLMSTALVHDANFAEANVGICRAYRFMYDLSRSADLLSRAEDYCQKALKQDDGIAEVYIGLAEVYRKTGKTDEAIQMLNRALQIEDSNIEAHIELAITYQITNRVQKAEEIFLSAVDKFSDHWLTYSSYAYFLIENGRFAESIEVSKRALEIIAENEPALNNLGTAHLMLGNYKKAAQFFDDAVNLVPTASAFSNTGTGYYFAKEYKNAKRMFREAIRLSPQDYRYYINLGDALRQIDGLSAEAKDQYRKAIKLAHTQLEVNERDPQIHAHLALSYAYIGDLPKTENHLNTAINLNPNDREVSYLSVRIWTFLNNLDKAMVAMQSLVGSSFYADILEADPDLEALKAHEKYAALIDQ